ncbi:MAG TPA: GNAT family N-acetyltransferase [Actinomycetota bacterium]
MIEYRTADLADVRELRHRLLRPHQRPEELVYPGDHLPDALHLGAFERGALVGVASICREPPPGSEEPRAWRIRGMATEPAVRGRGIGGELLGRCVAHAAERGAAVVWCSARVRAEPFYRRHGFAVVRGPYDVPAIGPHVEMRRRLR